MTIRKDIFISAAFTAALLVFSVKTSAADKNLNRPKGFSYVGAEKCGMCHRSDKQGRQLSIWKDSPHARAFKTLQTQKAEDIAKARGFKTRAAETTECLRCHQTAYDAKAAQLDAKFDKTQGVQCESCHGAGSEYQPYKVMKNRQDAVSKGLTVYNDKKQYCTSCHNSQSPTFKGFNFDKYWASVQHYKAAK